MSHARNVSEAPKTPHAVSLKVLRLSKAQLAFQFPVPEQTSPDLIHLDPRAALSYASEDAQYDAILSPLLTLPASFGSVHVGETFSCTLCANNELPLSSTGAVDVRITAAMHTPNRPDGIMLPLFASHSQARDADDRSPDDEQPEAFTNEGSVSIGPGETLARMVRFDLREEGHHDLAVTVNYWEPLPQLSEDDKRTPALSSTTRGKVRTFRKLYRFPAQQLLSVRTKAQMLSPRPPNPSEFILEAQIENLGESMVQLDNLVMTPSEGFKSRGLNTWDLEDLKQHRTGLALDPKQVLQSCFLFNPASEAEVSRLTQQDGRVMLGQLSIDWRGPMGEKGSLSTGTLGAKHRKY